MEKIGIEIKYTFHPVELKDLHTFLRERNFQIKDYGCGAARIYDEGEDRADGVYTRDPDLLFRRPNIEIPAYYSHPYFWLKVKGDTRLEKTVQSYEAEQNQENRK